MSVDARCTASMMASSCRSGTDAATGRLMNAVLDLRDASASASASSSSVALIIMPFWQKPHMRHLLVDPGLLHRVQRLLAPRPPAGPSAGPPRGQPFERRDLLAGHAADRQHAGARLLAVDQHRTGAALRQAAAELRARQLEVVAQHVEQRRVVGGLDLPRGSVHGQCDGRHVGAPWRTSRDHIQGYCSGRRCHGRFPEWFVEAPRMPGRPCRTHLGNYGCTRA